MGEGADVGAAADMGGAEAGAGADAGGGGAAGMLGGGGEADTPIAGSTPPTTGEGGTGGGMIASTVSDSMMGGSSLSASTMGITPPTANVSGAATTPVNAGANGSGDIIRKNPFGGQAGTPQKPMDNDKNKQIAQALQQAGKKMGEDSGSSTINMTPIGGSTYGALFGSPNLMARQAPAPMQMPAMPGAPQAPQAASAPAPTMGMAPPPPMAIQSSSAPVAPQVQLGSVSDRSAKTNIRHANKEMDQFLEKFYNSITKGKK